ncbi:MAG TPA: GH25 family lysozyme [Gaiellaceae bacterium]
MQVVGAFIGARRGQLGLIVGLVLAFSTLVPASSSAAATGRARGIDVSNWNGKITWSKVASAGYSFAFGKATEGTSYSDPTYTTNRNGSETAGLVFGAYHFARPAGPTVASATAGAIAQANHFLAVAGPQPGELPPVLDLEATGKLPSTRLLAWTLAWLGQIYAATGVQPFLYTSPNFWKLYLGNSTAVAAAGTELWIAHWTSNSLPLVPALNWNGAGWLFWQWSNCVTVPGINHCTDADRMNGTQPSSVAIEPYPTGPPVLSTPPSLVGAPEAGQLLAAVPGNWVGGKPLEFAYQWLRCDAAGANCATLTGATAESYRPVSADVGHSLKVVVTAASDGGSATAASAPTVAVSPAGTPPAARPANLAAPQAVGTAQAGQMLTASVGTWSGAPTKFTYHWRRCNSGGVLCVAIKFATQSHYTLTPDDIGSTLSLVVTATGAGGAASATAAPTGIVVAAPLPPLSTGTQTVRRGVAGNLQTADGRAVVTWQPGAVGVGRTVSLAAFTGALSVPGTEVSLTVPGLSSKGFKWPLDLMYAQPQASRTVVGYSTDGKVFHRVPPLQAGTLVAGTAIGSYVDPGNRTHVLTRTPLQLALFKQGAWGDPTYTSPNGPALRAQIPLEVLAHRADRTILLSTRLSLSSQAQLSASVVGPGRRVVSILAKGSRLGVRLRAGRAYRLAQVYRSRPGAVTVRLRLNARAWRPGAYRLRLVAVDPWRRRSVLTLRFRYP